jgi:hypothetical protein
MTGKISRIGYLRLDLDLEKAYILDWLKVESACHGRPKE